MAQLSQIATIADYPKDPLAMFKTVLDRLEDKFILMNLASIDSEFGVLNRTVVYRGLVDGAIAFVTERNTRKFQNLKDNPKVSVTFLFPEVPATCESDTGKPETWQVRLIDAEAVELKEAQIANFWSEESVFAKIRSHICECGKPVDHEQLLQQHDQLLQDFQSGRNKLDMTPTYTAFKILPKRWDFYKSEENQIADRVQYRKAQECDASDGAQLWQVFHVAP